MRFSPALACHWRAHAFAAALAVALAGEPAVGAPAPRAAKAPEELINWYYSAVFGTGFYTSGDRTVTVVQLPLAYTLQAPEQATTRITLKLPVSFGFYDLELGALTDGDLPERLSTMSVLPGVEAGIRLSPALEVRPFAYAGYGWELDGRDSAFIYNLGIKARWKPPLRGPNLMLGAGLNHAAYRAQDGGFHPLTQLVLGVNSAFPTHGTIGGVPADLGLHLIYYRYLTPLDYPVAGNVAKQLRNEAEFALSIGTRGPVNLRAFGRHVVNFDLVGRAFRVGEDVNAIRLFFSLPY